MAELKVPKMSPDEAHSLALLTWGQMYAAAHQAMVDKFGADEALEILRPYLTKIGEGAPIFAGMMGITGNDALSIASLFCLYEGQVCKIEGEVTEATPDRVVKESTKCPFQGLPPAFCKAFTIMAVSMSEAINPEYRLTTPKMMSAGDTICQWIVEKK
jgi:hypothetical protein